MVPELAAILNVPLLAFFQDISDEDRRRQELFEGFLAWRSATMGAEGSHSLV